MSAANHTQGPWHVFGAYADFEVRTPSGTLIAVARNQANARLIAAAPELLKACQQALYALKGREHDQFLRDAIAKATGSQP